MDNPTIKVRILGAKQEEYQGAKFYTLSLRLEDETVGDMTGVGTFPFEDFRDKDVLLACELRKKNGRFGIRAISAEAIA